MTPGDAGASGDSDASSSGTPDTADPIDRDAFANLLDMTGGDLEFVDELVDTWIEDGAAQVAALAAAIDSGSVEDLVRPAHSLKSSSLNVGALALGARCRTLEEESRSGSVRNAAAEVAAIAAGYEAARAALLDERGQRTRS